METKHELQVQQQQQPMAPTFGVSAGLSTAEGFGLLQRMARLFNSSTLVPQQFTGDKNFGNCVIALNMAQRLGADPLMVMQNLYVVYGNPSWSSKFLISIFNQCGRFSSIKYRETGKKGTDSQGIIAYAMELVTGEIVEGPEVTIKLAKSEGWFDKKGSKWQTMPDMMLRYRAATWLIRLTAPELSMGLQTQDEVIDVGPSYATVVPRDEIESHANSVLLEESPMEGKQDEDVVVASSSEPVMEDPGF